MTQPVQQGRNYLLEGPRSRHAGKTAAAFKAAKAAGFPAHFLSALNSPTADKLAKNLAGILREAPDAAIVIDLHGLHDFENQKVYKTLTQIIDEKKIFLKDGSTCDADQCTLFLETRDAREARLPLQLLTRLDSFKAG
jgi:hypothetical protein